MTLTQQGRAQGKGLHRRLMLTLDKAAAIPVARLQFEAIIKQIEGLECDCQLPTIQNSIKVLEQTIALLDDS